MALQLSWTVDETTYPNAYARVLNCAVDSRFSWVVVGIYADEAARWANVDPVKVESYIAATPSLTGDIYTAAYAFLKTLPEFAGAVDVLVNPVVEPPAPAPEPAPEPQPTQAPAEA